MKELSRISNLQEEDLETNTEWSVDLPTSFELEAENEGFDEGDVTDVEVHEPLNQDTKWEESFDEERYRMDDHEGKRVMMSKSR